MSQLQIEINKVRELIKLQQEAWSSVWSATSSNNVSTSNTSNTTNNVQVKVDWAWEPSKVANEIVRQIKNFNSWKNL